LGDNYGDKCGDERQRYHWEIKLRTVALKVLATIGEMPTITIETAQNVLEAHAQYF
jgi:hypothetical protein